MVSYAGLLQKLNERGLTKTALAQKLGISSRTIARIGRGEKIADRVLLRIAGELGCGTDELFREVSDNALLQRLRDEKTARISGGIYHELQVRMTYNSNRIEGSMLTEEQTRMIFETRSLDAAGGVRVDDIIETANHFRCVDMVIDNAEHPLTEDFIKSLHRVLKQGTADAALSWFAVGDYKKRANTVGGRETASPAEVPARMASLISRYEALASVTIRDIIAFHYEFEAIHPFQDGNGRVGRLLALKECLRHGIVPFIIEDAKKMYYYRGLAEWQREPGYLTNTCLDGQDTFRRLMAVFALSAPDAGG